tara:strand:+ start:954 stop:1178 length:225 start_codon:yes stop_codon:yes gene_type:complete
VGVLWLIGAHRSGFLFLLLLAALGLTFWEARHQGYDRRLTLWWLSVVGMTHVLGFLALRIWVARSGSPGGGASS